MNELQPLLDLLAGKAGWLPTVLTWIAAARTAGIFVGGALKRWAADRLNHIAATRSVDDDEYLRALFARPAYKLASFVLSLAGLDLPSSADLERAIAHQEEAAAAARNVSKPPTP